MKRTFVILLAALGAAAVFAGLVHGVLVAARVSDSAAITVHGLTLRRIWATSTALIALTGVVIGGLALARRAGRSGSNSGRLGSFVALGAGILAVGNGALILMMATGGPGSGNGVVGGAGALVLGMVAMVLGGLAVSHSRPAASAGKLD